MTTNCVVPPAVSYKDNCSLPVLQEYLDVHIDSDENGIKDFRANRAS